jgi:hypothetical protein
MLQNTKVTQNATVLQNAALQNATAKMAGSFRQLLGGRGVASSHK